MRWDENRRDIAADSLEVLGEIGWRQSCGERQGHLPRWTVRFSHLFLFKTVDAQGDYFRIAFQPNPCFHEETYQDRVVHAMSGYILIHKGDMRLCKLDGHLDHKVEFGFGIFGELSDQTRLFLARREISPGQWATINLRVPMDGRILRLKSLSRDVDSSRSGLRHVPQELTAGEAAAILRSSTF
jgi:hypothetical protein